MSKIAKISLEKCQKYMLFALDNVKFVIFACWNTSYYDKDSKNRDRKRNKIFLLDKKEETNEEKMKREERMNKALKRVKNKRKLDEENKKARKSAIIERISNELENELKKNEGKKLYVDLEYEENKEDEDSN